MIISGARCCKRWAGRKAKVWDVTNKASPFPSRWADFFLSSKIPLVCWPDPLNRWNLRANVLISAHIAISTAAWGAPVSNMSSLIIVFAFPNRLHWGPKAPVWALKEAHMNSHHLTPTRMLCVKPCLHASQRWSELWRKVCAVLWNLYHVDKGFEHITYRRFFHLYKLLTGVCLVRLGKI